MNEPLTTVGIMVLTFLLLVLSGMLIVHLTSDDTSWLDHVGEEDKDDDHE